MLAFRLAPFVDSRQVIWVSENDASELFEHTNNPKPNEIPMEKAGKIHAFQTTINVAFICAVWSNAIHSKNSPLAGNFKVKMPLFVPS